MTVASRGITLNRLKLYHFISVIAVALFMGAGFAYGATQNVAITPAAFTATAGTPFTLNVAYSTSDDCVSTSGVALLIYYNSGIVTFNSFSNVFTSSFPTSDPSPKDDTADGDGNATTDKYVTIGWADFSNNWPGAGNTGTFNIVTLNFTASASNVGVSAVNVRIDMSSIASDCTGTEYVPNQTDGVVTIPDAAVPLITALTANTTDVLAGGTITILEGNSVDLAATVSDVGTGDSNITDARYTTNGTTPNDTTGTQMTTADAAGPTRNYTATISGLAVGSHTVTVAGKDTANWSAVKTFTVTVNTNQGPAATGVSVTPTSILEGVTPVTLAATLTDPDAGHTVAAAEYYFDTDPGQGLATAITATFGTNPVVLNVTDVVSSGLAAGVHTLFVRGQDDQGKWGTAGSASLEVTENQGPAATGVSVTPNTIVVGESPVTLDATLTDPDTGHTVEAAEYYIDTDPGEGLATAITATFGTNAVTVNVTTVDTSALAAGSHQVFVRGKDQLNKWGTAVSAALTVNVNNGPAATGVTVTPATTVEGQSPVTLDATLTDPDTGHTVEAAEYYIDTDPGEGLATAITATFGTNAVTVNVTTVDTSALAQGTHQIFVRGKDQLNKWGTAVAAALTVNACDVQAAFTYAPTTVEVGQVITFTNTSTGALAATGTYDWDFGDATTIPGVVGTGAQTHTYNAVATGLTVSLKGTGTAGCFTTDAQVIDVICDVNAAFTAASQTVPTNVDVAQAITIVAGDTLNFTDASTGSGKTTAAYVWDFNGDGTADAGTSFQYTTEGTFTARLTLTSAHASACTDVYEITVNVSPCDVTAAFAPSAIVITQGDTVTFTNNSVDNSAGATYNWDFDGDGTDDMTGTLKADAITHQYTTPGAFDVTLTAVGPTSCTSTKTVTVYVNATACIGVLEAAIGTDATEIPAGGTVNFTDESTGTSAPTAWNWDIEDAEGTVVGNYTTVDASHTFALPGTYTVILTASDAGPTCTSYAAVTITVTCDVTANFTATPSSFTLPTVPTVTFANTSTGDGAAAATYDWDFNNDGTIDKTTTGTAEAPGTYTYPSVAGSYTAKMTATGAGGCTTVKTVTITVNPQPSQPPVNVPSVTAAFSADKTTGTASLSVKFTDASTAANCTLSSWSWTFGDGGTSTEQSPTYTYTTPGVYTVSLTASCSGASNTVTKTSYITVTGCTASFTATGTGNALEVLFDASASGNAVGYAWDFGDGATGEGVTATHIYAAAGTYTVKLKVTGANQDCVGVAQRTVIVSENCVASAYFTAAASETQSSPFPFPLPGLNTLTVNFDAEGSTGDTFAWDYGDGSTGSGKESSRTYAAAGTYTVTLTVTAANGCSATATQSVNIGTGCVADASFTAFTEENSLSVSFTADSSGTGYAWEFGDGSTASGMSANHTYAASGTYNVKLTVTSGTCTDTATQTVTVQTEECPAVAKFTSEDIGNLTVSFDTAGSVGTLVFDYGDGSTGTETTHTYAAAGTYTVKLTATSLTDTGNECSAVFSTDVTVTACAAKAVFTASVEGTTATFDTTGSAGTLLFAYGDGAGGTETTHTYSAAGTYEVVLTATADDGCTRETSRMVTITTDVCDVVAEFTAQPLEGSAPLTVTFNAGGSVGEAFAWNFGDGTSGTGQQVNHTYSQEGTYTVVLTVSDGNCTATDQAVILAGPACTLVAAFTAQPEQGTVPLAVTFNAAGSIGQTFAWNFGDGASGTGSVANHTYTAAGTYTVTLTVGGCGTATLQKTVTVTLPSADRPDAPVLTEPADGMVDVILQAILKTGAFRSPVDAGHGRSVWQIATDPDFTEMVFSLISGEELTSLTLPESVLNPGTSYYWRVRYLDANGLVSDWSEVFTFVTLGVNQEDLNGNGVPDSQEVVNPPMTINGLWVKVLTGEGYIGLEGLEGVEAIEWFKWLDIRTSTGLPGIKFPWGQFTWRLKANAKTVKVKVHFSSAMPQDALWYNYNLHKGWRDLTDMVEFAADMKSVTLTFTDGGPEDADGIENGWVVDPAGFGVVETTTACCEDKSDGGSCFIETAASGKVFAGLFLMLISGLSLLGFRKSQK